MPPLEAANLKTTSAISTKGGTGKTTKCANLGAFCADAGLRTLLIDLGPVQPSLSSYFDLTTPMPIARLPLSGVPCEHGVTRC